MKSNPLWIRIAEKIPVDFAERAVLPNIETLCRKYLASPWTLSRSLAKLREEGVLEYRQGSRIRFANTPDPEIGAANMSSARKVFRRMRSEITNSTYKVGESLPKISSMVSELHVSSSTVLKAYRLLVDEGYVRKAGKRYIVGKNPAPRAAYGTGCPIIAVLVPSIGHWAFLCTKSRCRMFGQAFVLESERRNVRIRLIPLDVLTRMGHEFSTILREVLDIQRNGNGSLVGALLAVTRRQYPSLPLLANRLRGAGIPVVWFDITEEGPIHGGRRENSVIESRIDERAAVDAALSFLHERGHRCIAFVPDLLGEWQSRRLESILEVAAQFDPSITVHSAPSQYEYLKDEIAEIDRLRKEGPLRVRDIIESVLHDNARYMKKWGHLLEDDLLKSPYSGYAAISRAVRSGRYPREDVEPRIRIMWGAVGLTALMYNSDVTAIVAANDSAARHYIMRSLEDLRIRVPEDVSFISFDNQFRETCAPPTTVDFGFFDLGYKAFHAIAGGVPVSINRHNEIRAVAFVVDRETVGWNR